MPHQLSMLLYQIILMETSWKLHQIIHFGETLEIQVFNTLKFGLLIKITDLWSLKIIFLVELTNSG